MTTEIKSVQSKESLKWHKDFSESPPFHFFKVDDVRLIESSEIDENIGYAPLGILNFHFCHINPFGPIVNHYEMLVALKGDIFDDGQPTYEEYLLYVGKQIDNKRMNVHLKKHMIATLYGLYPQRTNGNSPLGSDKFSYHPPKWDSKLFNEKEK